MDLPKLTVAQLSFLAAECKSALHHAVFIEGKKVSGDHFILDLLHEKELYELHIILKPFPLFFFTPNKGSERGEKVFSQLGHMKLEKCVADPEDRIVWLEFKGATEVFRLKCTLFGKESGVALDAKGSLPTLVGSQDGTYSSADIEKLYRTHLFELRRDEALRWVERKVRGSEALLRKIVEQLSDGSKEEEAKYIADVLAANFTKLKKGMEKITLDGWKSGEKIDIPLDPKKSPKDNIEKYFDQVHKLRKGAIFALENKERAEKDLAHWTVILAELEVLTSLKDLIAFEKKVGMTKAIALKKNGPEPRLPYRKLISQTGGQILVGRSAHDNDALTFSVANGNDTWMHVSGVPGSHVVVRSQGNGMPDGETLEDAYQATLYMSKVKGLPGEHEITVTQQKHVERIKGAPAGKVRVRSCSHVWRKFDQSRLNRLFKRH